MAELAGAYVAEHVVEGTAAAAYGIARSTLPLKGTWKRVGADSPLPRSSHSAVVMTGKAYIFGGEVRAREPVGNDVHVYSLPSGIIENTDYTVVKGDEGVPPARVGHSAVAIGRWMYVFGGRGGAAMQPLDEAGRVWCFDSKTNVWSALDPVDDKAPRPQPRSYHAGAASEHPLPPDPAAASVELHGTVFVHAGCPASGRLSDLWAFDVAARTWKRLPDAPGPDRGGPALACTGKRLYRFGGFDGKEEIGGQVDVLDLDEETLTGQTGGETASVATGFKHDGAGSSWQSIRPENQGSRFPSNRSVAGLHYVTTGQGRSYLVLIMGEKVPSGNGHEAAGSFLDDVWALQIKSDGRSGASFKDAARTAIGMKTKEYDWEEVQIPEAAKGEGRTALPGARGWFASSKTGDLDESGVFLWGGINSQNERLSDGYVLTVETA